MTLRPNLTGLIVSLAILLVLLLGTPIQVARAENSVTTDFESLASQVHTFYTDDFLYNHPPFSGPFSQKPEVDKNNAQFLLLTGRASEQELEALVKHPDPKVRTLALAALFQKEDPQVLPEIVALADDPTETFPQPGLPAQQTPPSEFDKLPTRKQTVGEVATAMVKFYMERAGYSYGIKGVGEETGFADYWQKRKDRKYCASWFAVQVDRALHGSRPGSRDDLPEMLAVRHRIDQLPPDDRAWTLLSLRDIYPDQDEFGPAYANMLVSKEELVKILQGLGPDKLLRWLQRKTPTDDPDLSSGSLSSPNGQQAISFLLKHAKDLFRPKDAAALIVQGQWEIDNPNKGYEGPWWWLAAAQLQPDMAGVILHLGYDAFRKVNRAADAFTPLTLALWQSGGEKETAFLTDWYYRSDPEFAHFFHVQSRCDFIDSLAKTAQPSNKKFLAHLLQDPRSVGIDPETLSRFAIAINGWLPAPIVSPEELDRLSRHHFKGGGGPGPEMVLGLLERLQRSIPQWNS